MIIDNAKIQEAKEKLGDENAFIMADLLGLEEFDERNLKALCCFHDEDTPSLIYDQSRYCFHCFSCQKTCDIVDCYMLKGLSFVEAVQKLFEHAGMKYSFGEHYVQTKSQYRYPKEEPETNPMDQVYEYCADRALSKETVDYCGLRANAEGTHIAFNFYDTNDVLTCVKYRKAKKLTKKEAKCFFQKEADTAHLLWNMNKVNPHEALVITEGEFDCMAAIEAGWHNAVSVPMGAGNTHWISEQFDWLEQFETIIICADNDEAGLKLQKEAVYRLGSWRTKVVDIPEVVITPSGKKQSCKDLNEYLLKMGKEATMQLLCSAKDLPVPSLVDFASINEKDLSDVDGIVTGIKEFDEEMMRLFYGTLNIVSGTPGSGKTSFLCQLVCNTMDEGKGVWLFSRELPEWMNKSWISHIFAGRRNINEYRNESGSIYHRVVHQAIKDMDSYYNGLLKIYRDDYPNDLESLQTSMIDSARKYASKLFIVDNLTTVDLGANENNMNAKQTEFVNWLIQFSMRYNVCVVLVCHPRKMAQTSEHVGMYDVAGTSNILNLAHRSFGLKRVTKIEQKGTPKTNGQGWLKPPNPYSVTLNVMKDRMRGRANLEIGLYYDIPSKRFYTNPHEFDKQYKWDKNVYTDKLPYPPDALDEQLFGPRGDK